ncbi:MAG: YkgJ family cysteine cluster protein [Proteobacteria bacterium]|nr:MAG: YkgJ family cysteine cluster protein [Pseudomonadota bacterium]
MKCGATEQAKHLINKAPRAVVEQFEKQYDHSMTAFAKVTHDMAYQTANLFIKETEKNTSEPISCKAGCGACCHQPVFVSDDEFVNIREYLIDTGWKLDKDRVQMQLDATDDGIYKEISVPDRRCVFLGENSSCSIYEARPLLCRRYNVYSDPKHCASGATKEIKYDVSPRTEGHLSAYFAYYGGKTFQAHLVDVPEIFADKSEV